MTDNAAYVALDYPDSPATMEALAAWLHSVYQDEARRQMPGATLKYPDAYNELPEPVKDFDRALAIFIMEELATPNQVREALEELGGI